MRLPYAVLVILLGLMISAQCQSRFVAVPLPQYDEKVEPSGDPSGLPELSPQRVTLTLYVRDGSASGPIISSAEVIGQDGSGNNFRLTTGSNGYVTIEGDPGTWSFSASADGYKTEPWDQDITETCTKHAFLQNRVTLTLYVHDGDRDGPLIPDATVTGHDGSGNNFQLTTDSNGYVNIEAGGPGNWSFSASAVGYTTESWDQDITETCSKHAFLQEVQKQGTVVATTQDSESNVVGKWRINFLNCIYGEGANECRDPIIIAFNKDGTLTIDNENTGKWVQDGNTIRFIVFGLGYRYDKEVRCYQAVYEGVLNLNTINDGVYLWADPHTSESFCIPLASLEDPSGLEPYMGGAFWSAEKISI